MVKHIFLNLSIAIDKQFAMITLRQWILGYTLVG
jgi:hypothetical protein